MSKHLLSVIVMYSASLVIMTATAFLAMWCIVRVPCQWAVLSALAVFAEGVYFFGKELIEAGHIRPVPVTDLVFTAKSDVVFAVQALWHGILNRLFNWMGLTTTWTYYYDFIEELSDRAIALETQAIQDRLQLASLLAGRVDWWIDWFEDGVVFEVHIPGEAVSLYPQDLEHVDKILSEIRFLLSLPLPTKAESEV